MLVLSRNVGEAITIRCPDGTEIELEVVSIGRWRVRLGITAPQEINVVRKERDDGRGTFKVFAGDPQAEVGSSGPGPQGLSKGPAGGGRVGRHEDGTADAR
jgi:carbon storage regulator CsrA